MKMFCRLFLVAATLVCTGRLLQAEDLRNPDDGRIQLVFASTNDEDKVTSIEQLFEDMKKSFRPDRAKGVFIRYQFRFKEPQASDRWIIVKDGTFTMGKGIVEHPDVTFSCSGADWLELSNGTLGGFRAYLTGRLRVSGSQSMARKLDELFP